MNNKKKYISRLNMDKAPAGEVSRYWIEIVRDGMGVPIHVPIMVAKGYKPGKVVGITAAVHGDELNGIRVVQQVFENLDFETLSGSIVGVPVLNIPSFLRQQRRFIDNIDLNHIMPGKPNGTVSQIYAWRIVERIIKSFDYLIDIHTASKGRINSYYVRADMENRIVNNIAYHLNPQIIVHNPPHTGTLRGTANDLGIPAITLEVGDPDRYQKKMIDSSLEGVQNVLSYLGITSQPIAQHSDNIIICKKSYWLYTDVGGFLAVLPENNQIVEEGEKIATVKNIFGDIVKEYYAPERGVVIGKSVNPVNQGGARILHLGIIR